MRPAAGSKLAKANLPAPDLRPDQARNFLCSAVAAHLRNWMPASNRNCLTRKTIRSPNQKAMKTVSNLKQEWFLPQEGLKA